MNITKKLEGEQLCIALEGRLDTLSAPELEKEIKDGGLDGVKVLIFDMAGLEYISSAGLRTLLVAKRELHNKGTVKVINANSIVKEVFDVTGFVDLLDVE
ncbi:STAS domain-containing protein [Butyrivibrio sp. MC2021]|uniref:STAS domain-containing protein n=1 Tax=Butyrivibrio sp. MC2021 TaxID=1408306 RepID=UPI00047EB782|nr:STAS domain-containing protein [Butyrivibrio sp. MC2021]